jgi:hypothetical protein
MMTGWMRLWIVVTLIGVIIGTYSSRAWYVSSLAYVDVELCSQWGQPGWSSSEKYSSRDDCDDKLMRGSVRDAVVGGSVIAASISGVAGLLFAAICWIVRGFRNKRAGTTKTVE